MEFIDPKLEQYAAAHTVPEDQLLKKINRETYAEVLMPRMLSGHIQGRILSSFSKMIKPQNILEIGTYTGYSALCLAEGLQPNGRLITIDINDELENRVRRYFSESAFASQIDFRIGNAVKILPQLRETFDLVFIDADKINYYTYYEMIVEHVPSGGFIIADNVLWSAKVLMKETEMDEDTLAIHKFNEKVASDPRVNCVLFPVRDGLMVMQKN
jgi:predicted O-methyltransferase YrrM